MKIYNDYANTIELNAATEEILLVYVCVCVCVYYWDPLFQTKPSEHTKMDWVW